MGQAQASGHSVGPASQRKRGAQPGHQGHSRALLDAAEVDSTVGCKPEPVGERGAQMQLADEPQRHQVFDVPPLRARVDEYRLYSGRWPTRSLRGDQVLSRGFSVRGTGLRHGVDLWQFMHQAVVAFIDTAAPGLLPQPEACAPTG